MSKFTVNVTNSTIGAQAIGDHSAATAQLGPAATPTQAAHVASVKAAQKALVDDEDTLEPLLHEVLGQFLRVAREIQIGQNSLAELQRAMKDTLEDIWAQKAAAELGPLPQGVKVLAELAKSPLMGEVVKKLTGV